jgi:hypothetical protein
MNPPMKTKLPLSLILALAFSFFEAGAKPFYQESKGLFSTRPDETKSLQNIKRFGPVGMGFELLQPAFVMRISNIEEGSPAAATGKLKTGQIIESINGQKLADIDPRIQLGRILAEVEATDGLIRFAIKGEAEPVTVKVPVLGAYSKSWPLNCPKSDRIVRQVADYLCQPDTQKGLADIGMLFLLSTGEAKDLEVVMEWARKAPAHSYPWYVGYGGIGLAECYLRTGDPEILANVQEWVDSAARTQHNNAWAGRGSALTGYGKGHLNAAGTHVVTFLLLAKECGAKVPDETLHGALRHFYRYAGRGNNPYGDDRPYTGFVDNGKNGKLAIAMAAAAALTPGGEESVYARARDVCAIQSFYTTTFMLHGHTGGGIGEIWRSAAMGLLYDKRPQHYREFMDNRKWHYDLSRRFDGSFGILGGGGYDKEQWGVAYPLAYTMPRKTLRITGAPPTRFSKRYQLPVRPWGTAADDAFVLRGPVRGEDGTEYDFSAETLFRDSSLHFLRRFHGTREPDDGEIRKYMHHHDFNIRNIAAHKVVGIASGYLGRRSGGGRVRKELVMEFLKHRDPRVRRAMFGALLSRPDAVTLEIYELAIRAVRDPEESWFIKDAAIQLLGQGSADQIVALVDLLLPYLKHEEAWLRNAALTALTPVAADERCFDQVLPAMGELVRTNQRVSVTHGFAPAIRAKIKAAGPEVQKLATETLKETFTGFAGRKVSPAGQNLKPTYDYHLEAIAASLADVPGGMDVLYEIAGERHPEQILPYKEIFLSADASSFGPKLRKAIVPIIMDELIPEFVGRNRKRLVPLAGSEGQSAWPGGRGEPVDELVALYERAGHQDYGWSMFADLRNAEWHYHSFDPVVAEQVPFDQLITRYREVTLPKGMEQWHGMGFEPATAGWRKGKSPFGSDNGKLPERPITKCGPHCVGPGCYGATKVNTLWEKEVLLLRGTFKVPPLKEDHRYRLRVNTGEHVGSGGGHLIYLNGRLLVESKQGGGRGSGGRPKGAYITREFREAFQKGEVTIAVKAFIRYNAKYSTKPTSKTPQGKFSLHLEEQKLPPMSDELVFKSASIVPMLSSKWQDGQDPEDREKSASAEKFRWDGRFVQNFGVAGFWKVIAQVPTMADFDPGKKNRANRPPFSGLHFKDAGRTDNPVWAWSGDVLMDLTKFQALKMRLKTLDGQDYLFVETGGFGTRNKPGWKSQLLVLAR